MIYCIILMINDVHFDDLLQLKGVKISSQLHTKVSYIIYNNFSSLNVLQTFNNW